MMTFYMPAGDIVFDGQNNIVMATGDDEFMQCVNECIRVNTGEWFLNKKHGFDRFKVLGTKNDDERNANELYKAIFQEPRVEGVENLSLDFDRANRNLAVKYTLKQKGTSNVISGEVSV